MNDIVINKSTGEITQFKPEGAGTRAAALAAAVLHAKNAKKWDELWPAVDRLIEEQMQVVAWWDANVSIGHGRPSKKNSDRNSFLKEDAEDRLGITQVQVSRWRSRLKRADNYRNTLYGAAYKKAMAGATLHVEYASGENDWYTPTDIIDRARRTMGGIDTDPASSEKANEIVQAEAFYTATDNGLMKAWTGSVWMNPPYSQPLCSQFAAALVAKWTAKEFERACVLVNNATETSWFQPLLRASSAVCFPLGRIKFLDRDGEPSKAPLQGQAILYFGDEPERFDLQFSPIGAVLTQR